MTSGEHMEALVKLMTTIFIDVGTSPWADKPVEYEMTMDDVRMMVVSYLSTVSEDKTELVKYFRQLHEKRNILSMLDLCYSNARRLAAINERVNKILEKQASLAKVQA